MVDIGNHTITNDRRHEDTNGDTKLPIIIEYAHTRPEDKI